MFVIITLARRLVLAYLTNAAARRAEARRLYLEENARIDKAEQSADFEQV